jgi:aryl-alcohol dehydrogenase-like predicted oxidoreductase
MCRYVPPDSLYGKCSLFPSRQKNGREKEESRFDQYVHRYGIRAFDTAPYYDNSEIVLGTALKALENEFPRGTYKLLTKVGRYGPGATDFDYTPTTIRRSVRRSLQRLHTQYLDVVFLHDVEFVAPCIAPRGEGNHASALGAEAVAYGLASEQDVSNDGEGEGGSAGSTVDVRTPGDDERILEAISELRALQADGLIRQVGISGPSVSRLTSRFHPLTQIK